MKSVFTVFQEARVKIEIIDKSDSSKDSKTPLWHFNNSVCNSTNLLLFTGETSNFNFVFAKQNRVNRMHQLKRTSLLLTRLSCYSFSFSISQLKTLFNNDAANCMMRDLVLMVFVRSRYKPRSLQRSQSLKLSKVK